MTSLLDFLDTVAYTFLSFGYVWMLLATLMLLLKRRSHTAAGRRWPCSFREPRAG